MDTPTDASEDKPLVKMVFADNIGTITMDNSRKANCLSEELITDMLSAFDKLEKLSARVVLLRAAPGAKVWSSGHNIQEIPVDGQDPLTWNMPFEKLLNRVRDFPAPVIGVIEGSVWGGACDLAITCDMLVASPTATFAITPAKIGLSYNASGLTHFLGAMPTHIIKEMFFTAQPIGARQALDLGILNRLVGPEKLEETALALARTIASRAPLVIKVLKAELGKLTAGPPMSALDFEEIQYLRRLGYRSEDFKEGIKAFFEKRAPDFKGR